jgi:hypothetical protein
VDTKDNVVFPMFKHHKMEALTKALIDSIYENGEGASVAEVVGAIEFCKMHFINEAYDRVEGEK